MEIDNISNMIKGRFIGNFEPSLFRTNDIEVAIKEYKGGDKKNAYFHKNVTEIIVVVSGQIRMFNKIWNKGSIIIAEPGDITSFEAVTDSVNVVVKIPGVNDDKYVV